MKTESQSQVMKIKKLAGKIQPIILKEKDARERTRKITSLVSTNDLSAAELTDIITYFEKIRVRDTRFLRITLGVLIATAIITAVFFLRYYNIKILIPFVALTFAYLQGRSTMKKMEKFYAELPGIFDSVQYADGHR